MRPSRGYLAIAIICFSGGSAGWIGPLDPMGTGRDGMGVVAAVAVAMTVTTTVGTSLAVAVGTADAEADAAEPEAFGSSHAARARRAARARSGAAARMDALYRACGPPHTLCASGSYTLARPAAPAPAKAP